MKLQSLVLSLILIARHLAVLAQEQTTENANADDPFSNNWQSKNGTNKTDEFSAVSNDDGAEANATTKQQSEWRVTERSTIANNQETIAVDLNTTAMLKNHSDTMATVTEPFDQYEVAHASLTPVTIISTESITSKTSRQATHGLTTLNTAPTNSANEQPSITAEEVTGGIDASSTNSNNVIKVTVDISDVTQENGANEVATESLVSMSSMNSGTATIQLPLFSTEETQQTWSTTLRPTKATTVRSISSNAAESLIDVTDGDNANNHYFTDATVTEPDGATNAVETTLQASVYSVNGDATTAYVANTSADEMLTTAEPTKANTASGIWTNAAEPFTNGSDVDRTNNDYFPEVTLTKPGAVTQENAASEIITASLNSVHNTDSGSTTLKLTYSSAEEMESTTSTTLELKKTSTQRGTSFNAAGDFTDRADGDNTSNQYFTEAKVTDPDYETEENVLSETVTTPFALMHGADGATTVEVSHASAEDMQQNMSTALGPIGTTIESSTSSSVAEPGDQSSGASASETVTESLAVMYSSSNDAATLEVTHASAEEMQRSMSTAFEPAKTFAASDITSNAAEELTHGTDDDSTNKPFTEVTLTSSGDQTDGNIASVTTTTSLASMHTSDSPATTAEVSYSSAEDTQLSRSATSKPTRSATANSISSNTAEEFTDGADVASSVNHYVTEVTFTEADNTVESLANETTAASLASMYSVGGNSKTIEVTNAATEETSELTDIITARGISLNTADESTEGTVATQLHDSYSTNDRYVTEVTLTKPSDEIEGNVASETVTAPLASMYSLGSNVTTITVTYASAEIAQRSISTAVEAEITSNAISASSNAAADFSDDNNGGSTDNKYFTVVTLTNSGDETDGNVDSQATTTQMALMSSIDSGSTTAEVTHSPNYETKRSSLTTLELVGVTNTNFPTSDAAESSPGVSNDDGVGSSYVTEQASTVNNDATEGYFSDSFSSPSLDSMSNDGKTATTVDFSPPSVEDVQWSKTSILEGKGTTHVNAPLPSTEQRHLIVTSEDSSLTEPTLADRGSTIENFDDSATPTAEATNDIDVSLTDPSNATATTPTSETSSLGPSIANDTLAEIRRNNSVVVSLSMSLAEYTKDFEYNFRFAVAQAANDYCKRTSCYGSGGSSNSSNSSGGGDEGNGGRPRVRRAAVTSAPSSPTAGGSTTASPAPGAASATTLAVLFTIADVGIVPGYPVSNGLGGIDVATYLLPPAGLASSVGSAYAFIVISGEVLVAIISANQGAVADALGVNITGIIRLPEKVALDAATSAKVAAPTAASTAAESAVWMPLVASLVSVIAVLLVIAAAILIVKKLKRKGSASVTPSITKLNVDERPSSSTSGDMWYAAGSTEVISHARRNRNLLDEMDVSTSLWYETSLPQEVSMGRRRVYRIAKDVPTLQYSPPEDTSYFPSTSPPPSYSVLPPIRNNR